jgi:citrate lyase subunit beta/citryl-CoA lyase
MIVGDPPATPSLTYLFVPAHESRKVAKALASDSDAVILDLEDGVPDSEKAAARCVVRDRLAAPGLPAQKEIWVRVNGFGDALSQDLAAVNWSSVTGAVVAMAEGAEPLRMLTESGARRLIPLIETVAGLSALGELAAVPGVERFALGTFDLVVDLGLPVVSDPDDAELVWQVRGTLVIESRRLGLSPPVDGVYAAIENDEGLRSVCERVRRLGFKGKLVIHPRQIPIVRSVFTPTHEELQFAREVVAAYDAALAEGRGAVRVRGRMIDRPIAARARALLARR